MKYHPKYQQTLTLYRELIDEINEIIESFFVDGDEEQVIVVTADIESCAYTESSWYLAHPDKVSIVELNRFTQLCENAGYNQVANKVVQCFRNFGWLTSSDYYGYDVHINNRFNSTSIFNIEEIE